MNSKPPFSFTNVHKYLRNSKQCERNVQRVNASNVFMQTQCEFLSKKQCPACGIIYIIQEEFAR